MNFIFKLALATVAFGLYAYASWKLEFKKDKTSDDEAAAMFLIFPGALFMYAIVFGIMQL